MVSPLFLPLSLQLHRPPFFGLKSVLVTFIHFAQPVLILWITSASMFPLLWSKHIPQVQQCSLITNRYVPTEVPYNHQSMCNIYSVLELLVMIGESLVQPGSLKVNSSTCLIYCVKILISSFNVPVHVPVVSQYMWQLSWFYLFNKQFRLYFFLLMFRKTTSYKVNLCFCIYQMWAKPRLGSRDAVYCMLVQQSLLDLILNTGVTTMVNDIHIVWRTRVMIE